MMVIVNYVIAVLLVITILYCIRLHKKIDQVRQGKDEFNKLIQSFDHSILKAEHNIAELKDLTSKAATKLNNKMEEAKVILDDMDYVGEKFTNLIQDAHQAIQQQQKQQEINKRKELERPQPSPSTSTPRQQPQIRPSAPAGPKPTPRTVPETTPSMDMLRSDKGRDIVDRMLSTASDPNEKAHVLQSLMERIAAEQQPQEQLVPNTNTSSSRKFRFPQPDEDAVF